VYQLHKIFSSEEEQKEVAEGCRTAGIGCIDCKKILMKNVFRVLEPLWEKRNELMNNPGILSEIVDKGTERAKRAAEETMALVRETMGLGNI
jgi:tryptophanyl-tRNA synthetase